VAGEVRSSNSGRGSQQRAQVDAVVSGIDALIVTGAIEVTVEALFVVLVPHR
jgi:hypothetical protein